MTNRFPSIYDDETVYSWFCRYLVNSGIWREHEIAKELFVNSTNVISKLFIGNINKDKFEVFLILKSPHLNSFLLISYI